MIGVVPSADTVAVEGDTVTVATGASVTVTVAVPDFPSLVAVMVALPGATPLTTPVADTVAMDPLLVVQAIARPVSVVPFASFVVAVSAVVARTKTVAVAGATVTVATGGSVTVTVAVPDLPSLVAVMVTVPGATPLTTPVADTVAMDPLLVVQVIERPVSVLLFASFVVAVNGVVAPCRTETELG